MKRNNTPTRNPDRGDINKDCKVIMFGMFQDIKIKVRSGAQKNHKKSRTKNFSNRIKELIA